MHSTHAIRCIRSASAFALALALLFRVPGLAAQTPTWKTFSSASDGFSAQFPSAPAVARNTVPVGADTYELRSFQAEENATEFYIGVCDYGARGISADASELLASAEKGAVDHMNAHILSERKTSLGPIAGLVFEAESDKLHFSVRMYKSAGVLYQVMVATSLAGQYTDAARFFDSFALIPRTAGATPAAPPPAPSDWKPYRFPTDGFSAAFPAQPVNAKQTIATNLGSFELRTYVAEDSRASLIAAVCDYGTTAAGKDPNVLIENAKTGAVTNLKAHIVSEKPADLDSLHKGIAFEAENGADHISARIYIVGSLLYQLIVIAPIQDQYAHAGRFLDSFQTFDRAAQ
jgi:hypothetical protein